MIARALGLAAAITLAAGCTSILGDFEVSELPLVGDGGHCKSDEQCRAGFHPESVCDVDAGSICMVHLEAGVK